jgi:serine protease inhibitor
MRAALRRAPLPLLALVVLLAACDSADPGPPPVQPRALTAAEARVLAADNAFTFRLLEAVAAEAPGENVFLSPFSVSMALGMTLNGARGETAEAIARALQKEGLATAELNAAYRGLLDLLPHLDRAVSLEIANAVFSRSDLPVEPAFTEALRTYFDAEAEALDFSRPEAAARINGWVRERTRGRIPELVEPPLPANAVMYLVNALYFKGRWAQPFDPRLTRDDRFRLTGGGTAPVRMMSRRGDYLTYDDGEVSALELPYGSGRYAMTVLLPRQGASLDTLLARLDDARWAEITAGLTEGHLIVEMPRLQLEYDVTLNDVLIALGMEPAFSPSRADFSGVSPVPGLYVSRVLHKTFVEVNEEGTEAAAATAVEFGIVSAPPSFRVDRPYVFAIRERTTGAILFAGRIERPSA